MNDYKGTNLYRIPIEFQLKTTYGEFIMILLILEPVENRLIYFCRIPHAIDLIPVLSHPVSVSYQKLSARLNNFLLELSLIFSTILQLRRH